MLYMTSKVYDLKNITIVKGPSAQFSTMEKALEACAKLMAKSHTHSVLLSEDRTGGIKPVWRMTRASAQDGAA